jgi:hypothetical protein
LTTGQNYSPVGGGGGFGGEAGACELGRGDGHVGGGGLPPGGGGGGGVAGMFGLRFDDGYWGAGAATAAATHAPGHSARTGAAAGGERVEDAATAMWEAQARMLAS